MSHIKSWELFLKSGEKNALIVEDDVVFTKDFKKNLEINMENVPSDYDILYLGCFGCTTNINFYTFTGFFTNQLNLNTKKINKYINKPLFVGAAHAYVITQNGAMKLIHHIKHKISIHIDMQINQLIRDNFINAYSLNKRIVYQTSTDDTLSTNISSNHPYILNSMLSDYYIDTKVKASYISTVSFIRIGNVNLTFWTGFFLILGIILSASDLDIYKISAGYLLLSLPDIYINSNKDIIILHYFILIIPFVILKYYNIWSYIDNKES
jgi:GR25 family glycosyltransferase involved in LPS biosynthesis